MDRIKLYCPIATLDAAMNVLERNILLCTELRDKLIALSM